MARPTHFLSIPLGQTHPTLRARIADLHAALNLPSPDSTLLAGPRRVHLTLGVMNLTTESLPTALDLLHRLPTLLPLTTTPSRKGPAVVPTSYRLIRSARASVQPNKRNLP